ncbi:hypothetical protein GCM10022393_25800 [Aquimarina addita]|uniref:4'-phosphopantetheinyl transferase domain-containing protein n=1 Tax=Aquimarina addita TaxID=870485 RepID=A0ABP6UL06_9FLAO
MIGNDIVDLHLARIQSNWRRRGWLDKICSISEQKEIYTAQNPDQTVWKLWSMKEAAYKAHQRLFLHPPRFNPIDFICIDETVTIRNNEYITHSEITDNYIHTIAHQAAVAYNSKAFAKVDFHDKKELFEFISSWFQVTTSTISLEKDDNRIPMIKIGDTLTTIPFSYTGHGGYAAYAISI